MFAERREAVIEQLYSESTLAADPESGIEVIRAGYTTPATEEAEASFDALAFTEALRRRLIDAQPLTEDELLALAIERAVAVRQAVITADMAVSSRIVVGDPVMVEGTDDDTLRMQVQLSTIDDLDVEASENPAVTSAGAY